MLRNKLFEYVRVFFVMTTQYPVKNMLLPRSFVYATNSETLVVQSSTAESRIRLLNSYDSQSFMIASSNATLNISKDSNVLASFEYVQQTTPTLTIPQGGKIRAPVFEVPSTQASQKSFVLSDINPFSRNQFAGFGYCNTRVIYQAPSSNDVHVFQVARDSATNAELMRIQSTTLGAPQIGIGTTIVPTALTLAVQGATRIQGDLTVTGSLSFDRTGIVQLNQTTQRIDANKLPDKVVFLDSNNKVDRSVFPQEYTFQYMKAQKNVGIGTKRPLQRLHVNGSSYFSERVGVGTTIPIARLHASETGANIPALRLDTNGGNVLEAYSNGSNIFTVYGTSATGIGAGVGVGTTIVRAGNVLQVQGNSEFVGNAVASNVSLFDTLTAGRIVVRDPTTLATYLSFDTTVDNNNVAQKTFTSTSPFIFQSGVSTPTINCYGTNSFVHVKNCGLRVDGDLTLGAQIYAYSDARLKQNPVPITNALDKLDKIRGYTYTRRTGRREAGVLAQEIRDILPEAVASVPGAEDYLSVSYDALIPLLIEAIRELREKTSLSLN